MTTVEKLFVQVFERKNWIIEQVKQQTDLYNQHLASKLLIDGITPPPWLWNPNFNSVTSDAKELKKEELISELLLPHPRPAVPYTGTHCYPYKPITVGGDGELSEELFREVHALKKGINTGDRPTTVLECHDNDIGCALNCVPELDLSATSPQWQTEERISNYTAPDQSLVRIQRSKSRQKALELRKTVEAASKSRFSDENDRSMSSSRIESCRIASQQVDRALAEISDSISDNGAMRLGESEHLTKEKDANIYGGRVTRSRTSCNPSNCDGKPLGSLSSSDIAKEIGDRMTRSQSNHTEERTKHLYSSNAASQKVTQSKFGACKKSLPADSLNSLEGFVNQNVSCREVIPPCPKSDAIVDHEGKAGSIPEMDHGSDGSVESQAACSGSNSDAACLSLGMEVLISSPPFDCDAAGLSLGQEVIVSRPPSDCSMFVKPKTLDFDDMEKSNLNEAFNPVMEKQMLDKSSGKRSCTSVNSAASLDTVTFDYPSNISLEKQPPDRDVSMETAEPWRASLETCMEECIEGDEDVSKSEINENPKNADDNSDAVLEIQDPPVFHGADIALSNVGHVEEGFKSSPKQQVEKGELDCFGRDRSDTTPFTFKRQQLGSSLVSSLMKHSTGDQDCLIGKVGTTDPSVDDIRQWCVEDDSDFLCVENKLDNGSMAGSACAERTLLERKLHAGENGLLDCDSFGSVLSEDKNFSSSREIDQLFNNSSLPERRLRSATEDSWPQFKQRKIEGQQTEFFSASPSCRVKEINSVRGHATNRYFKSPRDNLESVLQFQHWRVSQVGDVAQSGADKSPKHLESVLQSEYCTVSHKVDVAQSGADKSPKVKMHQNAIYQSTQGMEPSPKLPLEQGELGSKQRNTCTDTPSTSKHGNLGISFLSSLTKEAAGGSHGCSIDNGPADTSSIVLDVRRQCEGQNHYSLLHLENNVAMENKDDLTHMQSIIQNGRLCSHCSAVSPQNEHLASVDFGQTMPEFEGFTIDAKENEEPHIFGDAIGFDKLYLPSTRIERASILEQLCKSASLYSPLTQFSSTFKLHGTPDVYQSLPNGLLEHMDVRSTLNLYDDDGKQLRSSYSRVVEVKCALQRASYSDSVSYADPCCGCSSKNIHMSPVGKLWDQILSKSSSSQKQRSLNPELTCFPIEEDPSISGDNETRDEVADTIQEEICSTVLSGGGKREPVTEKTEACVDPTTAVSTVERFPDRSSLESIYSEVSCSGNRNGVKKKHGNYCSNKRRCTNEEKENRILSVSTNCTKRAAESLKNRFSKPKLSRKASLRKGGQSLTEKASKRNNIVSNINSFVPLVRQKQADVVGTGKRNIKVKALEAAEAAKCLEEKRQKDREMKKEALKLERARIEQDKMELKKKKEEEEQKKKDADIAARKRMREQDERKEKERKRRRIEDTRRRQREEQEKLGVGKVEKTVSFHATDEKVNKGKESNGEFRKPQKMEEEEGDRNIVQKQHTVHQATEISTSNVRQAFSDCVAVSHCGDTVETTSVLTKPTEKDDFMANTSREKSYDISPYQCSDDEEEDEEDEIPTKKFIPSWASKNSVALVLLSQQKLDPDQIFPHESFCSMDEVLRPRKLQLK